LAITSNKMLGVQNLVGADSVQFNLETWWKSNTHYSVMLIDTITLALGSAGTAFTDTVLDFGDYYSNVLCRSLNGAGDSGHRRPASQVAP
jgi:hypothetical protein